MAGLIARHQVNNVLQDRIGRSLTCRIKRRQCQPFDHNLHADEFQVPPRVRQNFVDDAVEVGVNRIHQSNALLDVLIKDLNVSRFVKCLRRGIQLRIEGWRAGTQLTGYQQRSLLPVKELRERPGIHM